MNKNLVYDLPTRLFHWLLVVLFYYCYFIASEVDSGLVLYSTHMLFGIVLLFLVLFRIYLGFFGSYFSRFKSLTLSITKLISYFKNLFLKNNVPVLGHNPASSWVLISVVTLILIIASSGLSMALKIAPEWFEELHAWSANILLGISVLHIFGVMFHSYTHKDQLWMSQIIGKKMAIPGEVSHDYDEKKSMKLGLILIAGLLLLMSFLFFNFNSETRILRVFNTEFDLGD